MAPHPGPLPPQTVPLRTDHLGPSPLSLQDSSSRPPPPFASLPFTMGPSHGTGQKSKFVSEVLAKVGKTVKNRKKPPVHKKATSKENR